MDDEFEDLAGEQLRKIRQKTLYCKILDLP